MHQGSAKIQEGKVGYQHGLFSWADVSMADPKAGADFYARLFGWDAADQHDPDGNYVYTMFSQDGKSTAGLGPQAPNMATAGLPPVWNSYVSVDSIDDTVAKWTAAGGTVMMPGMDVFDSGRMAIVVDPEGAICALWEAKNHVGAEVFNTPGAMTWNELNTRDAAAAMDFYGAALGWEFEAFGDSEPFYWLIKLPGKKQGDPLSQDDMNGGILTMDENWPANTPPYWSVYFQVADTDATLARVTELGGNIVSPAADTPAGRLAVVSDPQGGVFLVIAPPTQS